MPFNQDINGQRALAVMAVVLYHFGVPGFRGGFVGVDVFFVISGYLMTGIVIGRMGADRFSVWGFYADRARRIVPALVVLCGVLLVAGWFLLLPSDYKKLGKQVGGSLGFISNVLFWREAGYFDAASHRKWLLHTWSLSVEWQFYLLYPLLLMGLRRTVGLPRLGPWVGLLALASLAWSALESGRSPSAAFYLLPTRAWEMLLGAGVYLLALNPRPRSKGAMEALGMALVAGSVLLLDATDTWPGTLALLPTVGTALVMAAQRQASPLLGHPAIQWLGRASYSIYLWHWPVVVALSQLTDLGLAARAALGLCLSLMLGDLSLRFVETPVRLAGRTPHGQRRLPARLLPWAVVAGVVGVSAGIWATDGAPQRFATAVQVADLESLNGNPQARSCFATFGAPSPACVIGGDGRTSGTDMVGDSHALSVATALAAAAPGGAGGVRFQGYAACPTLRGASYGASENRCFDFNRAVLAELAQDPQPTRPLVITNHWTDHLESARIRFSTQADSDTTTTPFSPDRYRQALLDTTCELAKTRRLYMTLPVPEFAVDVPRATAYRLMRDPAALDLQIALSTHLQRNAAFLAYAQEAHDRCGVRLLDPTPYLCPDGQCRASVAGRPLYSDEHHLSEHGNRLLVPMFRQVYAHDHAAH